MAGTGPALKDYAARAEAENGHAKFDANSESAPLCDLLSVDGDHSFASVFADITNGYKITKAHGYVFADDVSNISYTGIVEAWSNVTSTIVTQIECSPDPGFQVYGFWKRWCIGQYGVHEHMPHAQQNHVEFHGDRMTET